MAFTQVQVQVQVQVQCVRVLNMQASWARRWR